MLSTAQGVWWGPHNSLLCYCPPGDRRFLGGLLPYAKGEIMVDGDGERDRDNANNLMAFLLTVANIYIPWATVLSAFYHLTQSWG